MCRLFAIRANKQVDIRFSMIKGPTSFRQFGRSNPDGWGIGWYEHGQPRLVKRPIRADCSEHFDRVAMAAQSTIFVSHVRLATDGDPIEANCHPFHSGPWLFAHNGCVDREGLKVLLDDQHASALQGQTDSEAYFQWLLQSIEKEGSVNNGLEAALKQVGHLSHTGLNFILTDGRSLYAYREACKNEHYYSLFYLSRDPRLPGPSEFRSDETGALLQSKALNFQNAVLICSEKLTDEAWKEIPLGTLLCVGKDLLPQLVAIQTSAQSVSSQSEERDD